MFCDDINNSFSTNPLLKHPVIQESLDWISKNASKAAEGLYEMGIPLWYVNVHSYRTLQESECRWENHIHTVDIQYTISGSEMIKWSPVSQVGERQEYLEKTDTEFFNPSTSPHSSFQLMSAGRFVIFLPGDAHCPKIHTGESSEILKLVVKIPFDLLIN